MTTESSENTSLSGDSLRIHSADVGEKFVRTLRDHHAFCYWCLAPLEVNPQLSFTEEGPNDPFRTANTFGKYSRPIEDVPDQDQTDEYGRVVEYARDTKIICGNCGVIDVDPNESRGKETTKEALDHLLSMLAENDMDVTPVVARAVVNQAFDEGQTGQFIEVLGEAVHLAVD